MTYEVKAITDLSNVSIDHLVEQSETEGYRFLSRLVEHFNNGKQQFTEPGEALLGVWKNDELVAIGGVEQNPYTEDTHTARLKRFYVEPDERRHGVGSMLLEACLNKAKENFTKVTCRTDSAKADAFYRHNGFSVTTDSPETTHQIEFK